MSVHGKMSSCGLFRHNSNRGKSNTTSWPQLSVFLRSFRMKCKADSLEIQTIPQGTSTSKDPFEQIRNLAEVSQPFLPFAGSMTAETCGCSAIKDAFSKQLVLVPVFSPGKKCKMDTKHQFVDSRMIVYLYNQQLQRAYIRW